jgi:3'-phosphoadenosine 5'-phosphosulfate sulfotransferase (PAPS reductase)/FAD synthetase
MDGWMYYTGLARQSKDRKALHEAKAGGMNHEVYTSHCTMRVTGKRKQQEAKEAKTEARETQEKPTETSSQHEAKQKAQGMEQAKAQ